jgi:hypothetical protein
MSAVPANVGVFFGQVDKRSKGWYWADIRSEYLKGAFQGPFESKEQAVEDALHSLASDELGEMGAACLGHRWCDGHRDPIIIERQLIKILQLNDCNDGLTQMIEEKLARRNSGGACQ